MSDLRSDPQSDPRSNPRDLLRAALHPTPECPPLETLLTSARDSATQSHLDACPHCRAELALFQQFEAAEALPAESADLGWMESALARRSPSISTPSESFSDRLRRWFAPLFAPAGRPRLALSACALLLVLTAGVVLRPGTGVQPGASQEAPVWRSSRFAALSPAGDIDSPPSQLRWESVPGAVSYHVRLLEVDGTEIWSADSAVASVENLAGIAASLTPGRAFQWDVAARDSAGRSIATTNLQSFHILATRR